MIPALIAGGAAAISALGGLFGQKSNNKAQMDLARYQNEYNLDMWNRQNEYNTPTAQMQRYTDAGLNPHLIYSQGNSGNATAVPQAVHPSINTDYSRNLPDILGTISQYQDTQIKAQQTDNLKAQNNLINQQALATSMDAMLKEQNAHIQLLNRQFADETYSTRFSRYNADYEMVKLRNRMMDMDFNLKSQLYNANKSLYPARIELLNQQSKSLQYENVVNQELSKYGLGKSSPWWLKPIAKGMSHFGLNLFSN